MRAPEAYAFSTTKLGEFINLNPHPPSVPRFCALSIGRAESHLSRFIGINKGRKG